MKEMGDSIDKKTMSDFIASVIDVAGFSIANYGLGKSDLTSGLKLRHVIIFAIIDIAIKQGHLIDKDLRDELWNAWNMRENLYIGVVYLVVAGIFDTITSHGVKNAIIDNAVRASVGVATNTLIDNLLLEKSKYK